MRVSVKLFFKKPLLLLYLLLVLSAFIVVRFIFTGRENAQFYFERTCMRENLRIFVYDLPQLKKHQLLLKNSQFATENMVHKRLLSSSVRTTDPLSADFYFVPVYPMGVVYKYKRVDEVQKRFLYDSVKSHIPSNLKVTPCLQEYYDESWCRRKKYLAGFLQYTVSLLDYWSSETLSDTRHIFIFPGGDQQNMFANWKELIGESVHLLVEGHYGKYSQNREDKDNQKQRQNMDIVIPGGGDYNTMISYKKAKKRNLFLSYCGRITGSKEREKVPSFFQELRRHTKNVSFQLGCSNDEFLENLRTSRYCLTPAGSTPWTSRLYGAIAQLCVPVLFNTDIFIVPYGLIDIFNDISIRISLSDGVESIVKNIIETDYEKKLKNLVEARNKFMVNNSLPELLTELSKIKCRTR